jgi:hypothetical protein
MALVVEDGTGLSTAESFISVADASTYHANRGNTAWATLSPDTCEQVLRKATDYMTEAYRTRWAGSRVSTTQALDWPRYAVPMRDVGLDGSTALYPSNAVPQAVKSACAALALKASIADLTPDLSQAVKSKKVGQVEVVYQDYSAATKTYRAIDNILAPLLVNGGGLRVSRA